MQRFTKVKHYKIYYCPFATSDLESEAFVYAKDQEDAQKVFERVNPGVIFKRAEEIV